jgi:hypothetical protein
MKTVNLFIISMLATLNTFAQENCDCDAIEQENTKLAEKIFQTKTEFESVDEISYICQLAKMPDKTFNALCERYQYNYNFQKQREKNPNIRNYFMFAENENEEINIFCENIDPEKEFANLPKDVQQRLKVIDNAIEMCKNIQKVLDNEISYNWGEVLDNGVNLVIKHAPNIEVPGYTTFQNDIGNFITGKYIKSVKDEIIDRKTERPHIDNWLADNLDKLSDAMEVSKILSPSMKIVTKSGWGLCIYEVIKSAPEVGKAIGYALTNINIHFRKDTYQKQIELLEREKQFIQNTKQLYNE